MRVVTSAATVDHVRERGGCLYVWPDPHRCLLGSYVYLEASTERPRGARRFGRVGFGAFELFLATGRLDPPDELHLVLKGLRRKRVEAYWNGCIFVG